MKYTFCVARIAAVMFVVFCSFPAWVFAQQQFKGLENLFTIPKNYVVNYTASPPKIDGNLNDAVWQKATWTDDFVDIEGDLKPHPALQTNVKMLWDDSCLYIAAQIHDPHVWANLKQHDQIVFLDNDFEVFINPNNTTHQYFELEFNALNTVFDLFLNKPYRNNGDPLINWNAEGLRSAVNVQGTLNDPTDVDKSWTVEIAIPFRAISLGNFTQVPNDGTTWRINFSRVEWDTKVVDGKYVKIKDNAGHNLPEHNWVWSPQGVIDMHFPERWGYLKFSKSASGSQQFNLPYPEQQKKYLWLVYYRQQQWYKRHHTYCLLLPPLGVNSSANIDNHLNAIRLEATKHQFIAFITDKKTNITYSINEEGLTGQLKAETK